MWYKVFRKNHISPADVERLKYSIEHPTEKSDLKQPQLGELTTSRVSTKIAL